MTKHIYENKGIRLYYGLPENMEDILYELTVRDATFIQDKIESILKFIDITTVDHEGGW